jgi:hypothetical protein
LYRRKPPFDEGVVGASCLLLGNLAGGSLGHFLRHLIGDFHYLSRVRLFI